MEIQPSHAALFPAGHDVVKPIAVEVEEFDAIGATRGIINGMAGPRLVGRTTDRYCCEGKEERVRLP